MKSHIDTAVKWSEIIIDLHLVSNLKVSYFSNFNFFLNDFTIRMLDKLKYANKHSIINREHMQILCKTDQLLLIIAITNLSFK